MEDTSFLSVLISWAPMLLLIAVYLFVVKKYSANPTLVMLIEKQNQILDQQKNAIEKIAVLLEKRN